MKDILIFTKVTRKLKGKKIKSNFKKFRIKKYTKSRLFRNCYPEFRDLGKSEVPSLVNNDCITVGITFKYQVPVAPEKITLNFQISDSNKDNI